MTQIDESTVTTQVRPRRWGRVLCFGFLAALVVGAGMWLKRSMVRVELVSPGTLVVEMDQDAFADGYYRLLSEKGWQIVRESSRGSVRDAVKLRVGRSERTFRMDDGMEVIVDTTHDGDRHIVFLSFRPTGEAPSNEEMKRQSAEITNVLADAWRAESKRSRWGGLKRLLR